MPNDVAALIKKLKVFYPNTRYTLLVIEQDQPLVRAKSGTTVGRFYTPAHRRTCTVVFLRNQSEPLETLAHELGHYIHWCLNYADYCSAGVWDREVVAEKYAAELLGHKRKRPVKKKNYKREIAQEKRNAKLS